MIRTHVFPCTIAKAEADALNRESGRVYTATLVEHYRVYRHTGNWLSPQTYAQWLANHQQSHFKQIIRITDEMRSKLKRLSC